MIILMKPREAARQIYRVTCRRAGPTDLAPFLSSFDFAIGGYRFEFGADQREPVMTRFLAIVHILNFVSSGELQRYAALSRIQSNALAIVRILDGIAVESGEEDRNYAGVAVGVAPSAAA